jgi:hypothetical protein
MSSKADVFETAPKCERTYPNALFLNDAAVGANKNKQGIRKKL